MRKSTKAIVIYGIFLYIIWAILELIIVPVTNMDGQIVKEVICKSIFWLLPSVYLIKKYNEDMYIKSKEMYSIKGSTSWILIVTLIIVMLIIHMYSTYTINGKINISGSFDIIDVLEACSVGLAEEMVFRGCFLNRMLKEKSRWLMISFNAILFLFVHFPIWIREGVFVTNIVNGSFITIIVLSIVFSWVFVKCKNLWGAIILHVLWGVLCVMFV